MEEQEFHLRAEKEELEIKIALATANAKLKVLQSYEGSIISTEGSISSFHQLQLPPVTVHQLQQENNGSVTLCYVLKRQNDITEFLVKQQRLIMLPPQSIPVLKGDPINYTLFIRAFEHYVENKTENNSDRLYFLEQHTSGQSKELI